MDGSRRIEPHCLLDARRRHELAGDCTADAGTAGALAERKGIPRLQHVCGSSAWERGGRPGPRRIREGVDVYLVRSRSIVALDPAAAISGPVVRPILRGVAALVAIMLVLYFLNVR